MLSCSFWNFTLDFLCEFWQVVNNPHCSVGIEHNVSATFEFFSSFGTALLSLSLSLSLFVPLRRSLLEYEPKYPSGCKTSQADGQAEASDGVLEAVVQELSELAASAQMSSWRPMLM